MAGNLKPFSLPAVSSEFSSTKIVIKGELQNGVENGVLSHGVPKLYPSSTQGVAILI